MTPKSPYEDRDWILERAATTDFSTAQDEIDIALADENPNHPDSIELRRLLRESERASEMATAMLLVLEKCLPLSEGRSSAKITDKVATITGTKVLSLLWLLRSERYNLASIGQSDIARGLGCTRALISHFCRSWNRSVGVRCRMQKRVCSSNSYRDAARRGWAKRRGEEIESPDALDHASPAPCDSFRDDDDEDQDFSDDHVPSWARGRGDDDADMDTVAD
jgi:hypothetical protein